MKSRNLNKTRELLQHTTAWPQFSDQHKKKECSDCSLSGHGPIGLAWADVNASLDRPIFPRSVFV